MPDSSVELREELHMMFFINQSPLVQPVVPKEPGESLQDL